MRGATRQPSGRRRQSVLQGVAPRPGPLPTAARAGRPHAAHRPAPAPLQPPSSAPCKIQAALALRTRRRPGLVRQPLALLAVAAEADCCQPPACQRARCAHAHAGAPAGLYLLPSRQGKPPGPSRPCAGRHKGLSGSIRNSHAGLPAAAPCASAARATSAPAPPLELRRGSSPSLMHTSPARPGSTDSADDALGAIAVPAAPSASGAGCGAEALCGQSGCCIRRSSPLWPLEYNPRASATPALPPSSPL